MSNSARWRRLLEWLRDLSDSSDTDRVNYDSLMNKIEEIKRGVGKDFLPPIIRYCTYCGVELTTEDYLEVCCNKCYKERGTK